ncbi:MAG: 50S ribosomal protein L11 methyltransferase [Desulfobacterales bacterium]|nr:50S ribosomal protein L11 methyltransferase [Desulfobacterales bacterium]
MKWMEAKITFDSLEPETAISLISDFFIDIGQQGVCTETPEFDPGLDWADGAAPLTEHYAVIGYMPANADLAERCRLLEGKLVNINHKLHINCRATYRDLDEQDWAESWKAFFYPIKVSEKIVIKPTWREHIAQPGEIIIDIDPGMAFGTGTHPTTAMCIRLIEKYIQKDAAFLDIGTGSGILLLAAEKLGASRLAGIDSDDIAVAVASENLIKNQVPAKKIQLITGSLVDGVSGKFQLVAANIIAEVIVKLLGCVRPVLADNAVLICSGIIEKKMDLVSAEITRQGFETIDMITQEEWVALAVQLTGT